MAVVAASIFVALLPLGVALIWALANKQTEQPLQYRAERFGRVDHGR